MKSSILVRRYEHFRTEWTSQKDFIYPDSQTAQFFNNLRKKIMEKSAFLQEKCSIIVWHRPSYLASFVNRSSNRGVSLKLWTKVKHNNRRQQTMTISINDRQCGDFKRFKVWKNYASTGLLFLLKIMLPYIALQTSFVYMKSSLHVVRDRPSLALTPTLWLQRWRHSAIWLVIGKPRVSLC